jgi:hypothetical protein
MTGTERNGKTNGKDPQPKQTDGVVPKRITEPQRKRMFGIAKDQNVPFGEVANIFKTHGFQQAFEITQDKYDAIVAEVQKWTPTEGA